MNNKIEWKKFDLHLHTIKTPRDNKGSFVNIDYKNVDNFINVLKNNNISLIAVTNHNILDWNNYVMIRDKAKEENIKVLLGVEINFNFEIKQKFQANLILNDESENINIIIEKIENEINKLNSKKNEDDNTINFKDFLEKLSSFTGEYLLILDYAKSSSNVKDYKLDFNNILYFDFFEGQKNNDINFLIDKMKSFLNIQNFSESQIMGTDNRNFEYYPNDNNEWTGTFFLVESSFYGLKQAAFFNFLIYDNFTFKNEHNELTLKNKEFIPKILAIQLSEIDFSYDNFDKNNKIYFTVGVNCIIGRRGSGKTKLFEKIQEHLNQKNIKYKSINQNAIISILTNISEQKFMPEDSAILDNKRPIKLENAKSSFMSKYLDSILNQYIKDFNESVILFNKNIQDIESNIKNIFEKEKDYLKKNIEHDFIKILNSFTRNEKEEENNIFNNTISFFANLKRFIENFKSETNEFAILKILLTNFNIENFLKNLEEYIKKIFKTNNFYVAGSIQTDDYLNSIPSFLEKINVNINEININFDNIKNFYDEFENRMSNMSNIKDVKLFFKHENNFLKDDEFFINLHFSIKNEKKYKFVKQLFQQKSFENFYKNNEKIFSIKELDYKIKINDDDFEINENVFLYDTNISNFSPGEKVKLFIQNLLNSEKIKKGQNKIILMDQPEDQLDAQSVYESIILPIQENMKLYLSNGYQFIFITHDPKISVNLSPMNFIICQKNNEIYVKNQKFFTSIFKEDDICNIVDGSKEILRKRSKIYGK